MKIILKYKKKKITCNFVKQQNHFFKDHVSKFDLNIFTNKISVKGVCSLIA